jgi:Domain of unknown function (DUF1818)
MARQLKLGKNWRIGLDPDAASFQGLVGAEDWAVELTRDEFDEFCQAALKLSDTVDRLRTELMDEETITCEHTSDRLYLEVRGYPDRYQLSFILLTGRRAEGTWDSTATPELLRAIQMLQVF